MANKEFEANVRAALRMSHEDLAYFVAFERELLGALSLNEEAHEALAGLAIRRAELSLDEFLRSGQIAKRLKELSETFLEMEQS